MVKSFRDPRSAAPRSGLSLSPWHTSVEHHMGSLSGIDNHVDRPVKNDIATFFRLRMGCWNDLDLNSNCTERPSLRAHCRLIEIYYLPSRCLPGHRELPLLEQA